MPDKLSTYRQAATPLPDTQRLFPLYGAGLENLGVDGKPIEAPVLDCGPDSLVIRHDACGLCFSDIKVISQGEQHPRIQRDMRKEPVVLGHEVSMTIMAVGESLCHQYHIGQRITLQTDIVFKGKAMAYGYLIQGGLSQYSVIDERVLNSDQGNFLIPLEPTVGYAEAALAEPWACVLAAYRLKYRTGIKAGGTTWIIGAGEDKPYTIGAGFDAASHPHRLLLTDAPAGFERWLRGCAAELGVEVIDVPDVTALPQEFVDDIILLGADADLIEKVSPRLAMFGVFCIMADRPLPRKVSIDVGRVHYHRWVYVGSTGNDIAEAYSRVPVRSALKPSGRAWFVGAGGPMGRMHVQRAIQFTDAPCLMLCTDVTADRLEDLYQSFKDEAISKGIEFVCLNPAVPADAARIAEYQREDFDDIIVTAPVPAVISEAATHLGKEGVMNVFAGLARGSMVSLDMSDTYLKDTRIIGHSASEYSDMQETVYRATTGELATNRSVAAVGSLSAARDGYQAVKDMEFSGKVVIYPQIKEFPLTALPDLKDRLPSVYALLKDGKEWTNAAEEEFLRLMLPD
ncbi:MAG TPA: alcohol dehydrogenase catalytic domain-containing protein [Anaerolineaceae bacterium]|nr:alcohol dehydrogenase catalytic domain-containing protein [Anaerolineaceae bacterium]